MADPVTIPNARTIRKRLMASRRRVFWGERAFVSVRVPWSVYPEPLPPFVSPLGFVEVAAGQWERRTGSTTKRVISIGEVSLGVDPRTQAPERPSEAFWFLEQAAWGWRWWEGHEEEIDEAAPISSEEARKTLGELPEEMVAAYRARHLWFSRWARGVHGPVGVPVLDALFVAANDAKTTYHGETPHGEVTTFSVKWFYPARKLGLCAALHHAFRVARRTGVDLRLLRGIL